MLHSAHKAAADNCRFGIGVSVPPSQHFIRWTMSTLSSQYVAVTAFTVAGCNSSLAYDPVLIHVQKQGLYMPLGLCITSAASIGLSSGYFLDFWHSSMHLH